jgi:hypothetical protein
MMRTLFLQAPSFQGFDGGAGSRYQAKREIKEALENGWLDDANAELDADGVQIAPLHYPHLTHSEIFDSVEDFYRRFYFRAPKIACIVGEMVHGPEMMRGRLREGVEFFRFLRERREVPL